MSNPHNHDNEDHNDEEDNNDVFLDESDIIGEVAFDDENLPDADDDDSESEQVGMNFILILFSSFLTVTFIEEFGSIYSPSVNNYLRLCLDILK